MQSEFFILYGIIAAALGGIFGLCLYLGYRAGYAKAISTIKFGMEVSAITKTEWPMKYTNQPECEKHGCPLIPVKWKPNQEVEQICLRCWKEKIEPILPIGNKFAEALKMKRLRDKAKGPADLNKTS
jgi:hypothetical protein